MLKKSQVIFFTVFYIFASWKEIRRKKKIFLYEYSYKILVLKKKGGER